MEVTDLGLDNDVPQLLDVEEERVQVELLAPAAWGVGGNGQPDLATDEGHAPPELEHRVL